jgi:hypothetical protein
VIEKLDFLVRFWELKARHATLGEPLGPKEQVELLSLMQLVMGEFGIPLAGPVKRPKSALPAQLIGDGTLRAVEIRGITAAALLVASASPLPDGAQVIVRAADAVTGVEYTLPCKIVWSHPGTTQEACTMALVVDGIPTRTVFVTAADAQVNTALAMGRHERLVG